MRVVAIGFLCATLLVACAANPADDPVWDETVAPLTLTTGDDVVRIALVGDVILGRSIAPVVEKDPGAVFAEVRHVISQSDLALFNLESPLTEREHASANVHHFEADPSGAVLLADAGFDVAGLANNHSGDTGIEGLVDTLDALSGAAIRTVGVGRDGDAAYRPLIVEAGPLAIAILALDLTWQGPAADDSSPGLAEWQADSIEATVRSARERADVLIVGLHGGVEYRADGPDPVLDPATDLVARLGADVVWGHGPHVVRPVGVIDGTGLRSTVAAPSLGNFLFDQQSGLMAEGAVLEVMVDADGVVAYRMGRTDHSNLRVEFEGWDLPSSDAAAIDGDWWQLVRVPESDTRRPASISDFPYGDVFDAVLGDVTGDGRDDAVVSYRYPFRETLANEGREDLYADAEGRAAHFGIFEPDGWVKIWAAGTMLRPAEAVLPCGSVIGFGYSDLDTPGVVAVGAAEWIDYGFAYLPELEGSGYLRCGDVDGDGRPDLIVQR